MNLLFSALALLDQVHPSPGSRVQQTMKAFIGLGVMIIIPTVMIWWARKNYRP
ncbi:MAG TPA: hypothetical protein VJ852_14920 [Gemmatimonadaceae bacterium]|nr:hypothetical protein [Gemmatimonadaceae bacterium]